MLAKITIILKCHFPHLLPHHNPYSDLIFIINTAILGQDKHYGRPPLLRRVLASRHELARARVNYVGIYLK